MNGVAGMISPVLALKIEDREQLLVAQNASQAVTI
jgi:hypothetical protein